MVMTLAGNVANLLHDGYEAYRLGAQGHLLGPDHRRRIRDALRRETSDADRLELSGWLAAIYLAVHDRASATQALIDCGLLERDESLVQERIREVESWKAAPHVAGLMRLNLSRFVEQGGHREAAEIHARAAVRHLEKAAGHPKVLPNVQEYAFLLGCEARLHLARMEFVLGRQPDAEQLAGEVRLALLEQYSVVADDEALESVGHLGSPDQERATLAHGFKAMLACAMSLRAYFDWTTGKFEVGRRRAFQALHLLEAPVSHDLARAMTLFTASRIEAMGATLGADLQVSLLRQAGALFHAHQHPMEWQTRVQIAQCLVKAGKVDRAEMQLDTIEREMQHASSAVDPRVLEDARGDLELARLWLEESRGRWRSVLRRAAMLAESASPRLLIEGLLHQGIALAALGEDPEAAMGLLTSALLKATESRRARIELRAHLAIAEYHPDEKIARRHFRRSGAMLSQQRGPVLRAIHARLVERFRFTTIDVKVDQSLAAAMGELQERYDEVVVGDGEDVTRVMDFTDLPMSTAYRIIGDAERRRKKR
jgi:hypothetical protein